jgi:hypothetical protein
MLEDEDSQRRRQVAVGSPGSDLLNKARQRCLTPDRDLLEASPKFVFEAHARLMAAYSD